jgi:hypothetical protein
MREKSKQTDVYNAGTNWQQVEWKSIWFREIIRHWLKNHMCRDLPKRLGNVLIGFVNGLSETLLWRLIKRTRMKLTSPDSLGRLLVVTLPRISIYKM